MSGFCHQRPGASAAAEQAKNSKLEQMHPGSPPTHAQSTPQLQSTPA